MLHRFAGCLAVIAAMLATGLAPAIAHPHVWVTMKSEVVYAADGTVTGVKHAWTFDDMFSAFATQGIETKKKGVFTREDLKPLAEVNVTSLKEFDYFTQGKADGKKAAFVDPVDYYLEYADNMLTLNFVLPLKVPVKAKTLQLEVYDPSYFVDFTFADKDPVALKDAPAACKLAVARPNDPATQGRQMGEAFFNSMTSDNYGAQYANKIAVTCP
jgi:ABC-type uncharacterized transport system substrate-binding protein